MKSPSSNFFQFRYHPLFKLFAQVFGGLLAGFVVWYGLSYFPPTAEFFLDPLIAFIIIPLIAFAAAFGFVYLVTKKFLTPPAPKKRPF